MRIVDLSQCIYDGMEVYEGDPAVAVTVVKTRDVDGWELRHLAMGSHTGTHCDAPIHMHNGGATLDEIPLSRFCGPAQLVSSQDKAFPSGGMGLLFSDHVDESVVPAILRANPNFVGGDLSEEAERLLLQSGCITYTDLVNLDALPHETVFQFYGFPLKIANGDGSPVRAVAIVT